MLASNRVWFGAAAALSLLAGMSCGGSSTPEDPIVDSGTDAGIIDCTTDPRVATYKAGMTVPSTSGALNFELVDSNPGPPAKGIDTWTLEVTNTSMAKQTDLNLSVTPYMPDHGHGTSIDASITNNGDGTYTVTPLYFFMPGVWRTTFTVAPSNDTAVFFFCVPG